MDLDVVDGNVAVAPESEASLDYDGISATSSGLRAAAEDVELEGMDLTRLEDACLGDDDEYLLDDSMF